MIRRTLLVASVLLATACTSGGGTPAATTPATTTGPSPTTVSSPAAVPGALPASLVRFGDYRAVALADPDTPVYPGPAAPTSLSTVTTAPSVKEALSTAGAATTLAAQGFVVVPAGLQQLHFGYQGSLYGGWPAYVTTDSAYHVWHLTFDKVLRDLEAQTLLPTLSSLVGQSLTAAAAQTRELAGTPMADAAGRAEQLYQVAAAELGLKVTLGPLARQEKALVDAHSATAVSPLLGSRIDYSLMTPRGHYTRTPALQRYFVTMSLLGQLSFCLPGTPGCGTDDDTAPLRIGVLASRALLGSPERVALWTKVYEPTAFLVGLSDDYTPAELAVAAKTVTAQGIDNPPAFAQATGVTALAAALTRARAVRIDPEKASVRLMGTRFVLDSFVMDQLIAPSVGVNASQQQRLLPSALDVAAALGSAPARTLLKAAGATDYQGYTDRLDTVSGLVADRPAADWGGTVYDAWLYAIQPVLADHGTAYPTTMRSAAWAAKDLQSGLGSYAQLKHDTILYTKQAVAEGGGDEIIASRRNWVEPEPVAFERLTAAIDLMRSGLRARKLLTDEQSRLLADVSALVAGFGRIARDELAGRAISTADNTALSTVGETFEALWFRTSDGFATGEPEADASSSLIADIASGPTQVLEVGTGGFDTLYILVPDDKGRFQVGVGAVFSYYEFATPSGQRLTDTTWREMLDAGKAPARPAWQKVLFAH